MEPLTLATAIAAAESDIARINAVAPAVAFDDPDNEEDEDEEPLPIGEKGDED